MTKLDKLIVHVIAFELIFMDKRKRCEYALNHIDSLGMDNLFRAASIVNNIPMMLTFR